MFDRIKDFIVRYNVQLTIATILIPLLIQLKIFIFPAIVKTFSAIPSHKKIYDYALSARNPFKDMKVDRNQMFIDSLISTYQTNSPEFSVSNLKTSIIALLALERKAKTQIEKAQISKAIAAIEKEDLAPSLSILSNYLEPAHDLEEKSYVTALIAHLLFFLDETQAIEAYERSLELYPENLYSLNALGHIYNYNGKYEKSADYFLRFITLATIKKDWKIVAKAKANLGTTYQKSGNYALAIKLYNEAINLNEKTNQIAETARQYYNLGQIAEIKKDQETACLHYRKARMIFYHHYQDKLLDQLDKKLSAYSCY